jgi:hypothetical protein
MDQDGHVKIIVDDDVCLRILNGVAKRCGGTVRIATVTRLELSLPNTISPYPPRSRFDRHAGTTPKAMGVLRVRG